MRRGCIGECEGGTKENAKGLGKANSHSLRTPFAPGTVEDAAKGSTKVQLKTAKVRQKVLLKKQLKVQHKVNPKCGL